MYSEYDILAYLRIQKQLLEYKNKCNDFIYA